MTRYPHYLQEKAPGRYHFRMVVPPGLRAYIGQREIKKRLPANRLAEARVQAQALAAQVQRAFEGCRTMAKRHSPDRFDLITLTIRDGVTKKEVTIERDDAGEEAAIAATLLEPDTASTKAAKTAAHDLATLIADYCREKATEQAWTAKTTAENEAIFDVLRELVGDVPVAAIDAAIAREVKQNLLALPPNLNKHPHYRNLTLADIIALQPAETLSPSSVNKYLNRISSLFDWACRHGYTTRNPFTGLGLRTRQRPADARAAFDDHDLDRLFAGAVYSEGRFKHAYAYWLPLLGLYTGARLNELCQLILDDVQIIDGVPCLSINDRDEKQLKSPAAQRVIPLHAQLLTLGFTDWCRARQQAGDTRVFPTLKAGRDGYGAAASKWFARYRQRVGITQPGKVFHSFRHTFANRLKQANAPHAHIEALLGHADPSLATGRYGKAYGVDVLVPTVALLSFPIRPKPFPAPAGDDNVRR